MHPKLCAKLLAALTAFWLAGAAMAAEAPQRPFGTVLSEWNRSLESISQELTRPELIRERAAKMKEKLVAIRAEATQAQSEARDHLKPLRERAGALGPAPAEGSLPEVAEVAQERRKIAEEIATYEGRIKQAELVIKRSDELDKAIESRTLGKLIETLLKPYPLPLAPDTVVVGVPGFFARLVEIARSPAAWWAGLAPTDQAKIPYRIALWFGLALVVGVAIRFGLLRWFGRDPAIEQPTYARRLSGSIAEGLAFGIVPALIFGVTLYFVTAGSTYVTGRLAEIVVAFCAAMIFFFLAWALPRAVLAPELPSWRLVPLSAEGARAVSHRITFLAGVFAIDLFFQIQGQHVVDRGGGSNEVISFYLLVTNSLEAAGILALMHGRLWHGEQELEEIRGDQDSAAPATLMPRIWTAVRLMVGALALAAVGATLIGYANLGAYTTNNLLFSGAAIGGLFLCRGLFRELIGGCLRSGFVREILAVRHSTRRLFKFWFRALLDFVFFASGVFLILTLWGVPLADTWRWTRQALQGFTIGEVTISISDILAALAVFVAALVVTRMLQRTLTERVLPRTRLDAGLRHSLSAGFGYLGLVLAVTLGIASLGLDLTNLALIFGALSVGIGFGLQNVVNNFVSGLILLIERPIKVGDWVVVGTYEGFVKRIRLRSTEIETFQRASIVIPNADIVSAAVTNWTHKDTYGRLDIPIRVAFGSDVEKVQEILIGCLREHKGIVDWPAPQALFMGYGEYGLQLEGRGFLGNIEQIFVARSELLTAIDKAFQEAGIVVPYPHREVRLTGIDRPEDARADQWRGAEEPGAARPTLRQVEAAAGKGKVEG